MTNVEYTSDRVNVMRSEWEYVNQYKVIRCGTSIEKDQKAALGYGGRLIYTLRCKACNMRTMVDASIAYDHCPHCGARMINGASVGPDEREDE